MMMFRAILLGFSLSLLAPLPLFAQAELPLNEKPLADPKLEAKAMEVMHQLRCIQCQGQSVSDSDAPIAGAMRAEVRSQIAQGKSKQEINDWMIGRYGRYVTFTPPSKGVGMFIWILPILLLLGGFFLTQRLFIKDEA
ncbi:hypothetical protein LPB140_09120 [Sphingorhabdus lutea]|uniref:Cytochrome c-type biogenesis protein n=1 Tax=Sphingorhabdus lutea TaxID=1913578 RepID=A0A1L3JCY0_9SPHN|nr:cytochrome c-type biogenesis protein [Sphingorhabdus lutea]APG62923.1 hypothetical protein LPB140_09120 [Sphingorhabdus lutea]